MVGELSARHLWAYTLFSEANRACLLSLTAEFSGHEVFYIVAPQTTSSTPSLELARQYYPQTEIRGELPGHTGFFSCEKAGRLLGWKHKED
jgi:UDP-glucose 4-epimerase